MIYPHPGANHNNDYHDNNDSSAINRGRQRHRHNTCTGGKTKEVDLLRGGVASHVGEEQESGAQRRVDGGGEQVHSQGDDARLPQSHTMLRFSDDWVFGRGEGAISPKSLNFPKIHFNRFPNNQFPPLVQEFNRWTGARTHLSTPPSVNARHRLAQGWETNLILFHFLFFNKLFI